MDTTEDLAFSWANELAKPGRPKLFSGFDRLDQHCPLLEPGFNVVAAPAQALRTRPLESIALHLVRNFPGIKVGFFTYDKTPAHLFRQLLSGNYWQWMPGLMRWPRLLVS